MANAQRRRKMPDFSDGFERAVGEIVGSLITSSFVTALVSAGVLSPFYAFLIGLGGISLIFAMPLWGTLYLLGWIAGVGIFFNSGLIGVPELIAYIGIPLIIIIVRVRESLGL